MPTHSKPLRSSSVHSLRSTEHLVAAVSSSSAATPERELLSSVSTFYGNGFLPCICVTIGASIFSAASPIPPLHSHFSTGVSKKSIARMRRALVGVMDGRDSGKGRKCNIGLTGDPRSRVMRF